MKDINSVTEVGRLTRDAEVHTFDNGTSVISFTIAVNTSKKTGEKWEDVANFFDVKYYVSKTAVAEMLKKGKQVCVAGYLQQDRWEKDGQKSSKIVIVASQLELCSSGSSDKNTQAANNSGAFQEDIPYNDGSCPF